MSFHIDLSHFVFLFESCDQHSQSRWSAFACHTAQCSLRSARALQKPKPNIIRDVSLLGVI